jgi:hypothetical protein
MERTGTDSCPVVESGRSSVKIPGSATEELLI